MDSIFENDIFAKFKDKIFKKKNTDQILADADKNHLKKTLTATDLIVLGIGAVIGAGIFTIIGIASAGDANHVGAGSALIISILIAGFAAILSSLCFAEMASMIPVSGSVYAYNFATMGELFAWIAGWMLMLEYAIGSIAVASAWTGYLFQFLKGLTFLPEGLKNPPLWLINDYSSAVKQYTAMGLDYAKEIPHFLGIPIAINLPAILILFAIAGLLLCGAKESTRATAVMVIIKMAVIVTFIVMGAFYVRPENWTPFAPNGFKGIMMGTVMIFFAFIGFEVISNAAEEAKNPQRDVPIGIIGTIIISCVVYILMATVLTGMMPLSQINIQAPLASAMSFIGQNGVAFLISFGALAALTTVLFALQYGTVRILFAMARDRLLPRYIAKLDPKSGVPFRLTILVAIFIATGVLFLDLGQAADLCNAIVFLVYATVCINVLILRKTQPDRERGFKVPWSPALPLLGALVCIALTLYTFYQMKLISLLFIVWMVVGLFIYLAYGYRRGIAVDPLDANVD